MFRGIQWSDLFPYLCHEIWKDRNECSFKGSAPSSAQGIIFKASRLAFEHIRALEGRITPSPVVIPVSWTQDLNLVLISLSTPMLHLRIPQCI